MSSKPGAGPRGGRSALLEAVRQFFRTLWQRLLHNGPLKLGALLVAAIFWGFVRTDDTLISQRSLRAPLHLEGLAANQTVTGVPERVEVRLSGSSSRVAALNPDGIDAVLDLRGVTGEFEQRVRVFPPEGITLVRVKPVEVLGSVETLAEKTVPVRAMTLAGPGDTLTEVRVAPDAVVVRGAESQVARVTQALVPVAVPGSGEATSEQAVAVRGSAYAADAQGQPVAEVTLAAPEVRLVVSQRSALSSRRLPLVLEPVRVAGGVVQSATLSRDSVTVVGPSAALSRLERVSASLPETPELEPGQYTLDVTLALPEGVFALDAPQLSLEVRAPRPGQPEAGSAN
jgi:YbbR domain-containing protein